MASACSGGGWRKSKRKRGVIAGGGLKRLETAPGWYGWGAFDRGEGGGVTGLSKDGRIPFFYNLE